MVWKSLVAVFDGGKCYLYGLDKDRLEELLQKGNLGMRGWNGLNALVSGV